jgi:ribosomal protein S18 acetylase RimI-like enzyme
MSPEAKACPNYLLRGRRSTATGGFYHPVMRLRQATSEDDGSCFRLDEASLRGYVESIYGWNPDFQHRHHAGWFRADRLSIIEDDDGKAVGVVDVTDEGDHLYLSRIGLLPEAQGRGIGTTIVRDLLRQGRTVRLHGLCAPRRPARSERSRRRQ